MLFAIIVIGFIVWLLIGAGDDNEAKKRWAKPAESQSQSTPKASEPSADQLAKKQDCENRWLQAEKAGIILGTRSVGGVPQVVVDERTFRNVDYNTKRGYAETLNCAAFGDGRSFVAIEFVSDRTNKELARWTVGRGLLVN